MVLAAVARILVLVLREFEWGRCLQRYFFRYCQEQYAGTLVATLLLALLLPPVLNRFFKPERAAWLTRNFGDGLHVLLHDAVKAGASRLICVTLSDNKVYVGMVTTPPTLRSSEKFFRLLPLVSGFRDKETLEITFTTYYRKLIDAIERALPEAAGLKQADLEVLIPLAEVRTARYFSPALYKDVFRGEIPDEQPPKQPPLNADGAVKGDVKAAGTPKDGRL